MTDQTALLLLVKSFKDQTISEFQFYRELTETITLSLQCSRTSLWLYADNQLNKIVAVDLFDSNQQQHYAGMVLEQRDFAAYFQAMREHGLINAPDAMTHPATHCLAEQYFQPNGIVSLLDVGIYIEDELVGMFCCEHVGSPMHWTLSQRTYLEQAGKLITFALKPHLQEKYAAIF